ncbi:hypothetical protein SeLEV6574_g03013 [Synchytrium endobioticum]|uniref:BHLH domain-containing protein n=1 Tax=Synchytrium endobioticum TaxID=286115 RepID=A0A507D616_9FUNG|nr:hypothetical protein SeLEV6574_g03013 [Synchytrium endobioticum]
MHPVQTNSHSDDYPVSTPSATLPTGASSASNIKPTSTAADVANKRKISHSAIEKRRRERINTKIMQLKSLVPQCQKQDNVHKLDILQGAIDYILSLQTQILELSKQPHHATSHHQHHVPLLHQQQEHKRICPESLITEIMMTRHITTEHVHDRVAATTATTSPPATTMSQQQQITDFSYSEAAARRTSPVKRGRPTRPSPMPPRPASSPGSITRHRSPLSHHHYTGSAASSPYNIRVYSPIDSIVSVKSEPTDDSLPSPPSTHGSPPPVVARDEGEDPLRLLVDAAARLSAGVPVSASGMGQQQLEQSDVMSVHSLLS